jgi:hypothetical protein
MGERKPLRNGREEAIEKWERGGHWEMGERRP